MVPNGTGLIITVEGDVVKMGDNKGLTLIEIIIAITLLGIISIGMMSGFVSQFSFMKQTQSITNDVFSAQQRIELEIEAVKLKIQDDSIDSDPVNYPKISRDLFTGINKRTVSGYPRDIEVLVGTADRTFFTVIADSRMPEYKVASTDVSIALSDGTNRARSQR